MNHATHQSSTFLIAALGVSLLFNAFVLVGFVHSQLTAGEKADSTVVHGEAQESDRDAQVVRRVSMELDLTDQQRRTFIALRHKLRQRHHELAGEARILRRLFAAELEDADPDVDRLRELTEMQIDLDRQRRLAASDVFDEFLRELEPRQRVILSRRMLEPQLGHGQRSAGPKRQRGPSPSSDSRHSTDNDRERRRERRSSPE